jgi:predicted nuclease of predicted toxin-antitoxin system
MRFLADENIAARTVLALEQGGHEVAQAWQHCPGARDRDLLAFATAERRILLTRDLDFGELVIRDGNRSAGDVLLRYRRSELATVHKALLQLIEERGERLYLEFVVLGSTRRRRVALR